MYRQYCIDIGIGLRKIKISRIGIELSEIENIAYRYRLTHF